MLLLLGVFEPVCLDLLNFRSLLQCYYSHFRIPFMSVGVGSCAKCGQVVATYLIATLFSKKLPTLITADDKQVNARSDLPGTIASLQAYLIRCPCPCPCEAA